VTKEPSSQKEEIKQQLQKLREQANTSNVQINKMIETRDQLNEQVKKSREEVTVLKTERDAINEKVRGLKQQRDAIRAKSAPLTNQINVIKDKIEELKKKLPRDSQRELQEEHDAIEWKISTTSLDLKEEKLLIENVKQLEILLSGYKKIDVQRSKMKELFSQRKVFDDEADVIHKELTKLADKSQGIHNVIVEKVNAIKISRAQADNAHQTFLKTKEELGPLYEKITTFSMQLRNINEVLRDEYKARKAEYENRKAVESQEAKKNQLVIKEKEAAIKEKLEAQARHKLQKGEKLSWNEFQLVMGDDESEDDEKETQN
jgi:phosphoserine phosphatase